MESLSWGNVSTTRLRKEWGFTSVLPQSRTAGIHGRSRGQGCRRGMHRCSAPPAYPLCTDTGSEQALSPAQLPRQTAARPEISAAPLHPGLAVTSTSQRRDLHETKESSPQINHQSRRNHLRVPREAQNPPAFH